MTRRSKVSLVWTNGEDWFWMSFHAYLDLHAWGQARLEHQTLKEVLRVHLDLRARSGLGPCYLTSLPSCQGCRSPACYHRTSCHVGLHWLIWTPEVAWVAVTCETYRALETLCQIYGTVTNWPHTLMQGSYKVFRKFRDFFQGDVKLKSVTMVQTRVCAR